MLSVMYELSNISGHVQEDWRSAVRLPRGTGDFSVLHVAPAALGPTQLQQVAFIWSFASL